MNFCCISTNRWSQDGGDICCDPCNIRHGNRNSRRQSVIYFWISFTKKTIIVRIAFQAACNPWFSRQQKPPRQKLDAQSLLFEHAPESFQNFFKVYFARRATCFAKFDAIRAADAASKAFEMSFKFALCKIFKFCFFFFFALYVFETLWFDPCPEGVAVGYIFAVSKFTNPMMSVKKCQTPQPLMVLLKKSPRTARRSRNPRLLCQTEVRCHSPWYVSPFAHFMIPRPCSSPSRISPRYSSPVRKSMIMSNSDIDRLSAHAQKSRQNKMSRTTIFGLWALTRWILACQNKNYLKKMF